MNKIKYRSIHELENIFFFNNKIVKGNSFKVNMVESNNTHKNISCKKGDLTRGCFCEKRMSPPRGICLADCILSVSDLF